jgi:hypothetical protein
VLAAILVGWPLALLPSLALSVVANQLFPHIAGPSFEGRGPAIFVLLVLFSPILETLLMAAALSVLLRVVSPTIAVLASAMGWGVAHSLAAPSWGLVIWWPFLVFSTLFVVWKDRSIWLSLGVPAAVHMLQNLGPALLLASRPLS